jgi:hypothetical protein
VLTRLEREIPVDVAVHAVTVLLCQTEQGNLHMGVAYRDQAGGRANLHLGWEDNMSNRWNWRGAWVAPSLDPSILTSVAARCRAVWKHYERERKFTYSLCWGGTSFAADGALLLEAGAAGLSCATLVLALFRSIGVDLLVENEWPDRTAMNREFLAFLERVAGEGNEAVIQRLTAEVEGGVRRILPQEVAAACEQQLPAKYAACETRGGEIAAMVARGPRERVATSR